MLWCWLFLRISSLHTDRFLINSSELVQIRSLPAFQKLPADRQAFISSVLSMPAPYYVPWRVNGREKKHTLVMAFVGVFVFPGQHYVVQPVAGQAG